MEVEKKQQKAVAMESKGVTTRSRRPSGGEAVAMESKGVTARSRRPSGGEAASKCQKVADGDQATKWKKMEKKQQLAVADGEATYGKVYMARCSQEYIDALIRAEQDPILPVNMDFLEGYTGSVDLRAILISCDKARERMVAAHAKILQQYCETGVAYAQVVDKPGA